MLIRHTCDTRACVEPTHLLLGTHLDNNHDMIERGRAWWQTRRAGSSQAQGAEESIADVSEPVQMAVGL